MLRDEFVREMNHRGSDQSRFVGTRMAPSQGRAVQSGRAEAALIIARLNIVVAGNELDFGIGAQDLHLLSLGSSARKATLLSAQSRADEC